MANPEHLAVIQQGVEAINKWQIEHIEKLNLSKANLTWVDLAKANLTEANLSGADISGADLSKANLTEANLSGADLSGADLTRANLSKANLSGADLPNFLIVPEEGTFIAWKKLTGKRIAKLLIPEDAQRVNSLVGRKIRVSYCQVLAIYAPDGKQESDDAVYENPNHDKKLQYQTGKIVSADSFCDDIRSECAPGIHCFITRKEAREWGC